MWWGCVSSGKTLLCYIHKLQSQTQFTQVLGLGNYLHKPTRVTHITSHKQSLYLAASFSVLERIK